MQERLGLQDLADLDWRALPMYRQERLSERDPLAVAVELFLLQGIVPKDELDRLFEASDQDLLARIGLLTIDETGHARARASLYPVGDRLVFSDHAWPELPHPGYAKVPYDQVMFVGGDSRALAKCTVRRPVRTALDLCTGSGVQALLAAAHSERVLAVDINARAARCARFNAQVSGVTNLDVAVGDLFEPVRGERFDLITANPPFVPSPVKTLGFRDGGRSGEDIQKRIVAELPRYLAPGGMAQMVTELGEREHEALTGRLRAWLAGAPMNIHILRLHEYPAIKYAISHAKGDSYTDFLESIQEWNSNLRAQNYVRVVALVVSFQWSDSACGPPWERVRQAQPMRDSAGREIEAAFLAERLARKPDSPSVLKRSRLRRAGPIAILDAQVLGQEMRANAKATLLGQALPLEYPLDPIEREVLQRTEGQIAVSELLKISHEFKVGEEVVLSAIVSLLRKQLACIDPPTDGPRGGRQTT